MPRHANLAPPLHLWHANLVPMVRPLCAAWGTPLLAHGLSLTFTQPLLFAIATLHTLKPIPIGPQKLKVKSHRMVASHSEPLLVLPQFPSDWYQMVKHRVQIRAKCFRSECIKYPKSIYIYLYLNIIFIINFTCLFVWYLWSLKFYKIYRSILYKHFVSQNMIRIQHIQ